MEEDGLFDHSDRARRAVRVFLILALLFLPSCMSIVKTGPLMSAAEHKRLAAVYESKGEFRAAIDQYGYAMEADPSDPEVRFLAANVHLKLGEYGEAERLYKRALELAPDRARYLNNLAWVLMKRGRLEEAEDTVRRAVQRGGTERAAVLDTLGVILEKKGDYEGAERSFGEALSFAPSPAAKKGIYTHLAALYEKTGRREEALRIRALIESLEKK